ncbi:MAG TPA: 5'/3'-nucleotidase SurE [Gemmataceae bacterium]|jgi:5'-nucleotidase
MKLLLSNDDGIDAPGLAALAEAASGLGEVCVVAPVAAHSGCSHRVTTQEPIVVELRGDGRAAVHGTPADCVRVALHRYCPDFDWVLAGINAGGNLGADVYLSGTVSVVREAVLHGRPGIAFSCFKRRELEYDWPRAARWVRRLLPELLAEPWEPGVFWNVNLPHPPPGAPDPEAVRCRLDPHPLPLSFRDEGGKLYYDGNYHGRLRTPGRDVDVCFRGQIAVTRLNLFD